MKISEEEYEEYQQLKEWAKKQRVYQSLKFITELRDDIDLPIRKCVAMLALLGCKPIFSCCGFDYKDQPFYKSHQYGLPYVKLTDNIFTTKLRANLEQSLFRYSWSFRNVGSEVYLELLVPGNPAWRDVSCIHQSEEYVIGIQHLEDELGRLQEDFMNECTIADTNSRYKSIFRFWQYPHHKPWTVHKYDLLYL